MIDIQLLEIELSPTFCEAFAATPEAGAVVTFTGSVRKHTRGRAVKYLEFEAYAPMAVKEMQQIAEDARNRFAVLHVSMHHRVGTLYPGDLAVVIAVSAPHRAAAFEACQYCIDTLKKTVPIWKKEVFDDGEEWVSAHP